MELIVTLDGNRVRFEVGRIIDEKGAEALKKSFNELDTAHVRVFVLDLENVGYIGSAGVSGVLRFYKKLTANGGRLCIENFIGIVRELLSVARMNTVLAL